MNVYDIESLKNRISLIENELDVLKNWVDLLIKESNTIKIINVDSGSTTRYYDDDDVTHTHNDSTVTITE